MKALISNKKGFLSSILLCSFIACTTGQIMSDSSSDAYINPYQFPKEEYEQYMDIIKKIDPVVYEQMKKAEAQTSIPSLQGTRNQNLSGMVANGTEKTFGYPIMYIESLIPAHRNYREQDKIDLLTTLVDDYKNRHISPPITKQEQTQVMDTIKYLVPDLYAAIIKVDPTGKNHVKRDYNYGSGASVVASPIDGLPIILLDADEIKLPLKEFRFSMAHELGHYVLHSVLEGKRELAEFVPKPTHRILGEGEQEETQAFKKGKKVSGQLSFEETFQLAYSRIDEYEADRFAVIEMGIPVDDAIANAKREWEKYERELENRQKETFKRTHPLWAARIQQLESLRREVELNRARNAKPKPIDWQMLAAEYLQKYNVR